MNAYTYSSDVAIENILGFALDVEGEIQEETTEGMFELSSENAFNDYVLFSAAKNDILVIQTGTWFKQFVCMW